MLKAKGLTRVYRLGGEEIRALDGVDFHVRSGEHVRIVGASGSGKSTLLNLLAGLDHPTAGSIETSEGSLTEMPPARIAEYRARWIGMVFQSFNLIPHQSALQNVALGMLFIGLPARERLRRAEETLTELGLGDRLHHRPGDLSGGEQQRVALARALAKRPRLLLADEPTGNLDQENSARLAEWFARLSAAGLTIVVVTHDQQLAQRAVHRTLEMSYGRIVRETTHREVGPTGEGRC